jgi:hypothetical protein
VDLNTKGGDVLLLELSSKMSLDEGGLVGGRVSVRLLKVAWETNRSKILLLFGCPAKGSDWELHRGDREFEEARSVLTFPVPPSPTSTSLKVGV